MKRTNKLIALFLCILMIASVLPFSAFAVNVGQQSNGVNSIAHTCDMEWDFDDLDQGTRLSTSIFDDVFVRTGSNVRYDTTNNGAKAGNWEVGPDPSGVEGNNVLWPKHSYSGASQLTNGLSFRSNGSMDNAVVTLSYRAYITARREAAHAIPLLRIYYTKADGSSGNNTPISIAKADGTNILANLTEDMTTTDTDIAYVSGGGGNITLKAKTWYEFDMALNTETGEVTFWVNDQLLGTKKISGWSSAFEINYIISLRNYDKDHLVTAYVDDVALDISCLNHVNTYADFEDLTVGVTADKTVVGSAAGLNGVFNVDGFGTAWSVATEGEGENANTYLRADGSARHPFALDPIEDLTSSPFLLSFDFRPDATPGNASLVSLNKGTSAGRNGEGRIISVWGGSDTDGDGKTDATPLYFGSSCGNFPMFIDNAPIGEWTHIDIAVYPVHVSGVLTYYNFAIYTEGQLRLWTELSVARLGDAKQCFDVHFAENGVWKTVSYSCNYESYSPFQAYGNTLGSFYFMHYNNGKTSLDNFSIRPAEIAASYSVLGDEMVNMNFADVKMAGSAVCAACVAKNALLAVTEATGAIDGDKFVPNAEGKAGLTFGLNNDEYNFADHGPVTASATFALTELAGSLDVLRYNAVPAHGTAAEVVLAKVTDGVLTVGEETLATLEANVSYTATAVLDKANGTYTVSLGEATATGVLPVVTSAAGVIELGNVTEQKSLVFKNAGVFEMLTAFATEDASLEASALTVTRKSAALPDKIDVDFNDGTLGALSNVSGAEVIDGVLTLGRETSQTGSELYDVVAWKDTCGLMNSWLGYQGFNINFKMRTNAASTALVALSDFDGNKTPLIVTTSTGAISIPGSKISDAYVDGAYDAFSSGEFVDIAISVTAPSTGAEVASIFVDGKYIGNVACAAKEKMNLDSIIMCGPVEIDSLSIRAGMERVYAEETGIVMDMDVSDIVFTGSNRSTGAINGTFHSDGVLSFEKELYVAATESESAYMAAPVNAKAYSDIHITGAVSNCYTVVETEFKNIPSEDETTAGSIEILRLRYAYDNNGKSTNTHAQGLFVGQDGIIRLSGTGTGLCDKLGNPVGISSEEWTKVTMIVDSVDKTLRYAIDGELVYIGREADENGIYQSVVTHRTNVSMSKYSLESRVRLFQTHSEMSNSIGVKSVKVYNFNDNLDFVGVQTSETAPAVRFVAGIDILYYARVGIEFSRWDSETSTWLVAERDTDSVVTSILADGETITAADEGSRYIILAILEEIDEDGYLRVRPYYAVDSVKHFGEERIYAVEEQDGLVTLTPYELYNNLEEGVVLKGGDGYAVNKKVDGKNVDCTYDELVNAASFHRWGGEANRSIVVVDDPINSSNAVIKITNGAADSASALVDGVKTVVSYKNMSGRIKFASLIPADLREYIGKTMTVSVNICVTAAEKVVNSGRLADDGTTKVQEKQKADVAYLLLGTMTDKVNAMKTVSRYAFSAGASDKVFYDAVYEGVKLGEWTTIAHTVEITEEFVNQLEKTTDYTDENGYRYPLRMAIEFGSLSGYANELYLDDFCVIFE